MLFLLSLLLLFAPLVFQVKFGMKALDKWIGLKFWMVCLLSAVGQVLVLWIDFTMMDHYMARAGEQCGEAAVGYIGAGMVLGVIILLIMAMQVHIYFRDK